jgi:C-terminal processing protease CtpA/Prc
VLTSRANMDACEALLMMLRQNERVALVGERTWGSCGGAEPHELVPGLHVLLPASQLLRPDGSPVEGQGIAPDLEVRWPEGSGRDTVLDQALAALRAR